MEKSNLARIRLSDNAILLLTGTDESEEISFTKDGTFAAFYYGAEVAKGTYSVKGDLYIEESNDQNCAKTPMSFRYTFDGTNFYLTIAIGSVRPGINLVYGYKFRSAVVMPNSVFYNFM